MKVFTRIFLLVLLAYCTNQLPAQSYKQIAVIGSSTAFGYGVPVDSSWPNRVKAYYKNAGIIDTLYNIAVSSTDCYTGMPTGYVPPPGRNLPDPQRNITKALSFNPKPDVIIVSYPSNNFDWLTNEEILNCFQTIKNAANAENVACFISTTQPRETFTMSERQKLKNLKSLILTQFGFHAIDFWTDITREPDLAIQPAAALGDQIHLNSYGHSLLFQKVIAAGIFTTTFPLPVSLTGFSGRNETEIIVLDWSTSSEINSSHFIIERSNSGSNYHPIGRVEASVNSNSVVRYNFRDKQPLSGKNFYRLAVIDKDKRLTYSPAIEVYYSPSGFKASVYPSPSRKQLTINVWSLENGNVNIKIFDAKGHRVFIATNDLHIGKNTFSYPVERFASGLHYIKIESGQQIITKNFIKQ